METYLMNKTLRQANDIIYRSLFDMDTRALLIHFDLPAECYDDEDDDDLMDCLGILALEAVGEMHELSSEWLEKQPMNSVTSHALKTFTRDMAYRRAKHYKAVAKERGIDLLNDLQIKRGKS